MLSLLSAPAAFVAPMTAPVSQRAATVRMESAADLEKLAKACNPIVGYWCVPSPRRPGLTCHLATQHPVSNGRRSAVA